MDTRSHWERVYTTKQPHEVSWYRPHLEISLALVQAGAPDRDARIIDVGGGESTLVDDLLAQGRRHLTVLDVSSTALNVAKARTGPAAEYADWRCGDVTSVSLPERHYDVWHDRAVFHFLTTHAQRAAYVRQVKRSVKPGGHLIVATFGPEGPTTCSGLEVVRYGPEALHNEFGAAFRLERHLTELHRTPWGVTQQFVYCCCRLEAD